MSLKGKEHGSLGNMYSDYFLDYASYVIMERAVPHLGDGLKPVQRRILHAMRQMEDGRYNKVANIVGDTMKYHPHGNTAIEDAVVGMGQKDLLIDTQGNWGNVLTGDPSAAASSSFPRQVRPDESLPAQFPAHPPVSFPESPHNDFDGVPSWPPLPSSPPSRSSPFPH